jgi:hypothetical protein
MSKHLDEILKRFKQGDYLDFPFDIRYSRTQEETKQAIFQWVNDEVIGFRGVKAADSSTDYQKGYNDGFCESKLDEVVRLKQHGWKEPK